MGEMKKQTIERCIGWLDGWIATFGQAVVIGGRNKKEAEAGELLEGARLRLVEDMEARYGQNWQPGWMKGAVKAPEATIWQTAIEMGGSDHERRSYYLTLRDDGKETYLILRLSADGTVVAEPYSPREYDYDHNYDDIDDGDEE